MSATKAFFRRCPSCGRRFGVRFIGSNQVSESATKEGQEKIDANPPTPPSLLATGPPTNRFGGGTFTTKDSKLEEVKVIRDSYKCNRCNHEWSEEHSESAEHKAPTDYTGD